ncbi:hypothetical protein [Streptomyces xanthophaeus]|uniref:hypothetical protein n=1 Tax=Streptomyces xanthophaeus TaxID=67385 RepID=UPI003721C8FC
MPEQLIRPRRIGFASAAGVDVASFKPSLVKAVFWDVTRLHVSRPAARAAASVTRTVLTDIIDGAQRAAAEEARRKLLPRDLVTAISRDVELEVGGSWYHHSPTFKGLTGGVQAPRGSKSRRSGGVVGAHRFETGIRKLLRSRGAAAVPAMVRDLDGLASVFLTDLARDAAMVVREGGIKRFGTVTLMTPDDLADQCPPIPESLLAFSIRTGDGRTVGRDDVLAATTIQLFGDVRQRALLAARQATETRSDG